jgi:hypothetical protein
MIWHYPCPKCHRTLEVPWENISQELICPDCKASHYAPTPGEDHASYIEGERWPREMEEAVVALRGGVCVVPGCYRAHTTLVLRRPLTKGGRLSVENLAPACAQHASDRGMVDYDSWLARNAKKEPVIAAPAITITTTSADALPVQTFGEVSGVQPIAGQVSLPGPFPAGMRLLMVAPFVPGPANRVVLYYEWRLGPGESCRVVLGTWPRSDQPDFSKHIGDSKGYVTNEHRAASGRESSALLEIVLPESRDELWVAAVWIEVEHERQVITNYYLAAITDQPETDAI